MYSDPLREAIAEAEQLVAAAPHIETEADLLEGLQYLAGCIAGCMHLAFDYERDHPFLQSGTGPFTKMGLDNPDTLYFGTRLQANRDYVVSGRRGTTTDLSFQLLGGESPTITCRPARPRSTTVSSTSPRTAASNGGCGPALPGN
ncbi:hypothetical protein J113_24695 [Mycobacterium tuberculosis CAS/NITR204]|uniref:Uncharacterized protein n=1 Tax=Mycobacterium tuberculosis CAS/NITR204 TaxID=1310114 RepID=R4MNF4_MYCTX|nr:hypothetical protein J113_24695 [Mycobacterium tuberculosis CAS/NITR204]